MPFIPHTEEDVRERDAELERPGFLQAVVGLWHTCADHLLSVSGGSVPADRTNGNRTLKRRWIVLLLR